MTLLRLQPLEDRIVLDGAVAHDVAAAPDADAPAQEAPTHVVVVSNQVDDPEAIAEGANEDTLVIQYNSREEDLNSLNERISQELGDHKVASIALATEGSHGSFDLVEGVAVNNSSIENNAELTTFWENLASYVSPGGEVNILGCNVASSEAGVELMYRIDAILDSASGYDLTVNASENDTGHADLDGDWTLEFSTSESLMSDPQDAEALYFEEGFSASWDNIMASRNFSDRFVDTGIRGDLYAIGNTVIAKSDGSGGYIAPNDSEYADGITTALISEDGSMQGGSSRATLVDDAIPDYGELVWAGLYWSGDSSTAGFSQKQDVAIRLPDNSVLNITNPDQYDSIGSAYQGYEDITTEVAALGDFRGQYTVGDIQADVGVNVETHGGWSLFFVWEDSRPVSESTTAVRSITVYDGFQHVNDTTGYTATIANSDYNSPNQNSFNVNLTFVGYSGHPASVGPANGRDFAAIEGLGEDKQLYDGVRQDLFGGAHADFDDFFSGRISNLGTEDYRIDRAPFYSQTLGYDLARLGYSGGSDGDVILNGNGAGALDFTFANPGDGSSNPDDYYVGVVAMVINRSSSFEVRETFSVAGGDFVAIGNTILERSDGNEPLPGDNNGGTDMRWTDIDSNGATFNSSRALLDLPDDAIVEFAGLYWGGETFGETNAFDADFFAKNKVLFRLPTGGYSAFEADWMGSISGDYIPNGQAKGEDYVAFADVTDYVQSLGQGNYDGFYTAANISVGQGRQNSEPALQGGVDGGWSLAVIYQNPAVSTIRNITVFDGFAKSNQSTASVDLEGFVTPSTGQYDADFTVLAFEGDASGGDEITINGNIENNGDNPGDNFFNSTISDHGVKPSSSTHTPDHLNNLGFDLDAKNVEDPQTNLGNGATSATFEVSSENDIIYLSMVALSIEHEPNLNLTDFIRNQTEGVVTGKDDAILMDDQLQYWLSIDQTSAANLDSAKVVIDLPSRLTNVTDLFYDNGDGSNNFDPLTLADDGDTAFYDASSHTITFYIGDGATSSSGGSIPISIADDIRVLFRADVVTGLSDNQAIVVDYDVSFRNIPLNETFTESVRRISRVQVPTFDIVDFQELTEGNSGTQSISKEVFLSEPLNREITVDYTTSNNTATTGDNDYNAASGTLTFAANDTSEDVTTVVNGDTKFEIDERYFIVISNATASGGNTVGIPIADNIGSVFINNDDSEPTITITDRNRVEGSPGGTRPYAFDVNLSNASYQTITVDFNTADNTATVADGDYPAASGTITFSPDETSQTITIETNKDEKFEPDESFFINLSNASNATIADSQGEMGIVNDDSAPTISVLDRALSETNSNNNRFIEIALSNPSYQTITVDYATADGTATTSGSSVSGGNDYSGTSGTWTFDPGQTSSGSNIQIVVNGDTTFEADDTVLLNISNPSNATIADSQGVFTILNDDSQPTISVNDRSLPETDVTTNRFIELVLSNTSYQTITVDYATADDTAVSSGSSASGGNDYDAISGTWTFNPGQIGSGTNFQVDINGETTYELDDSFFINLSNPNNATIADAQGTFTIENDDAKPTITIDDVTLVEGDSGTQFMSFTTTLSNTSFEDIQYDFVTSDNTAETGDSDYDPRNATQTIQAGTLTEGTAVVINGDTKFESDENFIVDITPLDLSQLASSGNDLQGVGTIQNDDSQPVITIQNRTGNEGSPSGTRPFDIEVYLSNPSDQTVTVDYDTADNTATLADSDYVSESGTVTFNPGETLAVINIETNQDLKFEGDESLFVDLSNASNATIGDNQSLVTLLNDDSQPTISIDDIDVTEGGAAILTVSLSNASSQTITVDYVTTDDTATVADSDYSGIALTTLTFNPDDVSQTITVNTTADAKFETTERLFVDLSNASNATIADNQGRVRILNDDSKPTLSIDDVTMAEGDSGTTNFIFTVSLSNPTYQDVVYEISTADDSALVADSDYVAKTVTETILAGSTSEAVAIVVNGDTKFELDDAFFVDVAPDDLNAIASSGNDLQGVGTITNDDSEPTISVNDNSADEGDQIAMTISLSNASYQTITVDYATADDTATLADSDYTQITLTTLTFNPNETSKIVNVQSTADDLVESDEQLFIDLSSPSNAAIADNQGVATILNDDVASVVVTPTSGLVTTEAGGTDTFDVVLTSEPTATVTINLQSLNTNEGTVPASISFDDTDWFIPQTVTVTGQNDALPDGDILYTIETTVTSGDADYSALNPDDVTVTNTDDDAGETPPVVIYTNDDFRGDTRMLANTVLTVAGTPSGDNDGQTMIYVDVDSDGSTFNSSSANFSLPATGTVDWAGLFWGGDLQGGTGGAAAPTPGDRGTVLIETPTSGGYLTRNADTLFNSGNNYLAYKDVTSLVDAGGSGDYTVANVQAGTGAEADGLEGGWAIIVVFEDPTLPYRYVTVYNGFSEITNETLNVNISGFLTPVTGPVDASLGIVAFDGDASVSDDSVEIDGTALGDAVNPTDNFFNSTISNGGAHVTTKDIDVENQLGFDADIVDASSLFTNNQSSVDVDFSSGTLDSYFLGPLFISTSQHAPDLEIAKSVANVTAPGEDTFAGDTLRYTITVTNNGTDTATDVILTDDIPDDTSFVSGSLNITVGDVTGLQTDATGDDLAEISGGTLSFFLGSGASAGNGGSLDPAESTTITFDIIVDGGVAGGTDISNIATVDYIGEDLLLNLQDDSNTSTTTVVDAPTISIDDIALNEGDSGTTTFSFTVSLSSSVNRTISVDYDTNDGSALTADSDYSAASGTVTFSPTVTSQPIDISVNGDTKFEPNETFTVDLSNPNDATIADAQGVGTIQNDDSQPTISVDDVQVTEGDSGTTTLVFTVSLSNESSQNVSVDYAINDGSATVADSDYVAQPADSLSFSPEQTSKTVSVTINGDLKEEPNETLTIDLSNAVNASIADSQGVGTINNDDGAPTISIDDVTLAEGNSGATIFSFTVSLSNPSASTITVDYATNDGSATTADSDYAGIALTTLTFNPDEVTKTIDVTVNGDTHLEPDETFTVDLSNAVNAAIADNQGLGTITNDDSQPAISVDDVLVSEGDSGTTSLIFTVSLSNRSFETVTVDYQTSDALATVADNDYVALGLTTLTFNPEETSHTISVTVNGDTKFELNETLNLDLSNASNATIADNQGVGTIVNDDSQPSISINDVTQVEGNSGTTAYIFTISLSNSSHQNISVTATTADGSALVADSDYTAQSLIRNIAPGATSTTFTVNVNGDTKLEPDETFFVNLTNAQNATIADSQGLGTIQNDDSQPTISVDDPVVTEGDSGTVTLTFTVSLSNASSETITVDYATSDGTATVADSDYVAEALATLTFNENETSKTVDVTVNGDTKLELDETLNLDLSNAANASIADAQGVGTILNDDSQPTISIDSISMSEGDSGATIFTFTVSLSNASHQTVTVDYASADGSADVADSDYVAGSGTLTFNENETAQTIAITVNGDTKLETNETFSITLSNAANATIADELGVGTILNDDSQPTISIDDVAILEGDSGQTIMSFSLSLSNASFQTISVDYLAAEITATLADNDFNAVVPDTIIFDPGTTTQTLDVFIVGDTKFEIDENFSIDLSNPQSASIADNQGVGTILNDDSQPTISISDAEVVEGDSGTTQIIFTVELSNASYQTITVNYASADGAGSFPAETSDNDYVGDSGIVTFNENDLSKTIAITVNGDTIFEADETFSITLSGETNATISDGEGIGTIINDEAFPTLLLLSGTDNAILEGDSGITPLVIQFGLSAESQQAVSFDFASLSGTAVAGADFLPTSGTIVFNAGETSKAISVGIIGDTTPENNESFSLAFGNGQNVQITVASSTGLILNDDSGSDFVIPEELPPPLFEPSAPPPLSDFRPFLLANQYQPLDIHGEELELALGEELPDIVVTVINFVKSEGGEIYGEFLIYLKTKPTAAVSVTLEPANIPEGTIDPGTILFQPDNWNVPQAIKVTGDFPDFEKMKELIKEEGMKIITNPAVSEDPNYNNLNAKDVEVPAVPEELTEKVEEKPEESDPGVKGEKAGLQTAGADIIKRHEQLALLAQQKEQKWRDSNHQ